MDTPASSPPRTRRQLQGVAMTPKKLEKNESLVRDVLRQLSKQGQVVSPGGESVWPLSWTDPYGYEYRQYSPRQKPEPATSPGQHQGRGKGGKGMVHDMMPIIWTLRVMLMLPISISVTGSKRTFRFRWLSAVMLLTVCTWMCLVVIAYFLVRFRLDPVSESGKHFHFWDLIPKYASSISLCYIFFLPFTSWTVADRAITMIEYWQRLEASMISLTGYVPRTKLRVGAWFFSVLGVAAPVGMEVYALLMLPDEHIWMSPTVVHSMSFIMLGTFFWLASCSALRRMALEQADRMPIDAKRMGVRGLRAHRQIWLMLAQMLQLVSECWGRLQMVILGVEFVAFVSITFLFVHMIFANSFDKRALWLALCYVAICLSIFTICSSAQAVTDAVRCPATKGLLRLALTAKDDATVTEIGRFLDDIRLQCPRLWVCKLGVLDRSSVLSLFSLGCTYIVVLSQFTISSESSQQNFSAVDPGILDPDTDFGF